MDLFYRDVFIIFLALSGEWHEKIFKNPNGNA